MSKQIFLVLIAAFSLPLAASAEIPYAIDYQGRLTDAGGAPVSDGARQMEFRIYDAPVGGTQLWYSGIVTVTTTSGLFSVSLGAPPMNPLPDDLFGGVPQSIDTTRYLGITVGAEPEMSPRTKLTSTPYAFHALRADSADVAGFVGTDGVGTGALQDSSVTAVKLAPGAATAIGELVPGFTPSTSSTTPTTLYGVSITVPGPGKLQLQATGQMYLDLDATGSSSEIDFVYLGLCDDPDSDASCGGTWGATYFQDADNASFFNTTQYFAITRTFDIPSAGIYTYWLNAEVSSEGNVLNMWGQTIFSSTFAPYELEMSIPLKLQQDVQSGAVDQVETQDGEQLR